MTLALLGLLGVLGVAGPPTVDAGEPEPTPSLTLGQVLASVDETHPSLEEADRTIDSARGKRFAARGVWDPSLQIASRFAPVGYYENGQVDAVIKQATPVWGIGAFAGYRLGWGAYPVYKGDLETRAGGEIRAGIDVPIWRDGPIDARRAGIKRTRALADAADCDRDATRLKTRKEAANAYWRWVATGLEVRIQRDLLAVAEARDDALREQVAEGSIPAITVLDNERLVLDRESKLVSARQDFRQAMLNLSLYLRNDDQQTVRAAETEVPSAIPPVAVDLPDEDADVEDAAQRRPEICVLQFQRRAADVEVKLKKNQRAPSLNVQAFVSRDLGPGPVDLGPTQLGVGLTFEMPLALRKARGEYRSAKAEARKIDARARGVRDLIGADVRRARVDLAAADRQVELATRQVQVALDLADAERERFREGASDLVIVNLRELAAADAARLEVEARAAHQKARADYLAATGRGP